jgi:hypothetical protein
MYVDTANGSEKKNVRFRMDPVRKAKWLALCAEKKISQQDAMESLLDFVFVQDEMVQSMLLGQTKAKDDLIEVVLRRLRSAPGRKSRLNPRKAVRTADGVEFQE